MMNSKDLGLFLLVCLKPLCCRVLACAPLNSKIKEKGKELLSLQKLSFEFILCSTLSLVNDHTCFVFCFLLCSWPWQDKKGLSTAILIVYLDSAFNLPVSTKHMQTAFTPNPPFLKKAHKLIVFKYSYKFRKTTSSIQMVNVEQRR